MIIITFHSLFFLFVVTLTVKIKATMVLKQTPHKCSRNLSVWVALNFSTLLPPIYHSFHSVCCSLSVSLLACLSHKYIFDRCVDMCIFDSLQRIEGNVVHFMNGECAQFDKIIYCTGYKIDLPFLSSNIRSKVLNEDSNILNVSFKNGWTMICILFSSSFYLISSYIWFTFFYWEPACIVYFFQSVLCSLP